MPSDSTPSPWITSWLLYTVNINPCVLPRDTIQLGRILRALLFERLHTTRHTKQLIFPLPDEETEERKDALRTKVTKYMSRAEELKTLVREGRPRVASGDELIPNQLLSKYLVAL